VRVDPRTLTVLRIAQQLAEDSRGCFDVTVGGRLVAGRRLPAPAGAPRPHAAASWRDVELERDGGVRFHRPLWIDVGGIAKGYAVDRAIARLREHGVVQACVNAGGDLRVLGPVAERIALRVGPGHSFTGAAIELENGSLASSTGRGQGRRHRGRLGGPHLDGARRRAVGLRRFACVTAERCVIADALTKIVLSRGVRSAALLRAYGATAYLHDARGGWRRIGVGA
jgi:thiamine biosynthesis lipoprotein